MARIRKDRDSASKIIEFAILHIMAGVVFEDISKNSIKFSVPKTCTKDDITWQAEDIINSVKNEFVKSCFSDSELIKLSKEDLNNAKDNINFIYTIRDEDFDANESSTKIITEINNELQVLKLSKSAS